MASAMDPVRSAQRQLQKSSNSNPKFKVPDHIVRFLQTLATSMTTDFSERGVRLTPNIFIPANAWDFVADARSGRRITARVEILNALGRLAAGSELTPAKLTSLEIAVNELKPILVEKRTISQRLLFKKASPIKPPAPEPTPLVLRKRTSSILSVSRMRSTSATMLRRSSETPSVSTGSTRSSSVSSSSDGEQTSVRAYGESICFLADMVAGSNFRIGSQQLLVLVTEKLFPVLVDDVFAILQAHSAQVQRANGL